MTTMPSRDSEGSEVISIRVASGLYRDLSDQYNEGKALGVMNFATFTDYGRMGLSLLRDWGEEQLQSKKPLESKYKERWAEWERQAEWMLGLPKRLERAKVLVEQMEREYGEQAAMEMIRGLVEEVDSIPVEEVRRQCGEYIVKEFGSWVERV